MNFATRFRQLRRELDLTQETLAEMYNKRYYATFNKSTISQYENGKRVPDLDAISNWADLFGVSIDYLAGRTDLKTINDTLPLTSETKVPVTIAAHKANEGPVKNVEELEALISKILEEKLSK